MATVSEDLRQEGAALLAENKSEDIHKLADRIISVEPDNWYGLLLRGTAFAIDADFSNCISNWKSCIANVKDEATASEVCAQMTQYLTRCILALGGGTPLDFSNVGDLLNTMNDKLPESDDEVFITPVLTDGAAFLKDNDVPQPLMSYYGFKALVVSGFRAYVELRFFIDLFEKLNEISVAIAGRAEPKLAAVLEKDRQFANLMIETMRSITEEYSGEDLEQIEEYWLEHKTDTYLNHILQAYKMSAVMSTAGKLTGKIANKALNTEIATFRAIYTRPMSGKK